MKERGEGSRESILTPNLLNEKGGQPAGRRLVSAEGCQESGCQESPRSCPPPSNALDPFCAGALQPVSGGQFQGAVFLCSEVSHWGLCDISPRARGGGPSNLGSRQELCSSPHWMAASSEKGHVALPLRAGDPSSTWAPNVPVPSPVLWPEPFPSPQACSSPRASIPCCCVATAHLGG